MAERIQRQLAQDGEHPPISVSAGCAVYPEDGDAIEALIKSADVQLYHLKPAPSA